jgi:nucleoside-diphosphate-sugar epimerase
MKIVVIGGHGLIGSKVAAKLSAQGHDVIAASRELRSSSTVRSAAVLCDIRSPFVFHCAPVALSHTLCLTHRGLMFSAAARGSGQRLLSAHRG